MLLRIYIIVVFSLFGVAGVMAEPVIRDTLKQTRNHYRDSLRLKDPSLKGQFNFMLFKSPLNPEGYRMVAGYRLNWFWKNVEDSIQKGKNNLQQLTRKLKEEEKTVSYLKTQLSEKDQLLKQSEAQVSTISFFGIHLRKGTYQLIVWSIILGLLIILTVIIIRAGRKNSVTQDKSMRYDELSEEFQAFKSRAIEKERKLARELQDARNKLDDLLGK